MKKPKQNILKLDKPHVMVAVPSVRGYSHNELMTTVLHWCADPKWTLTFEVFQYLQPIDSCRNYMVEVFLKTKCTHLFMVDADIVPPIECLTKLMRHKKRIIAPVCFSMKEIGGQRVPYPVTTRGEGDKQEIHCGEGVEWVDNLGTGAVLLERAVVEKMRRHGPLFKFVYDERGIVSLGEDYYFSKRARELGETIWVDYSIHCKHYREVDILGVNDVLVAIQRSAQAEAEKECESAIAT